jgi:hypothetical protein
MVVHCDCIRLDIRWISIFVCVCSIGYLDNDWVWPCLQARGVVGTKGDLGPSSQNKFSQDLHSWHQNMAFPSEPHWQDRGHTSNKGCLDSVAPKQLGLDDRIGYWHCITVTDMVDVILVVLLIVVFDPEDVYEFLTPFYPCTLC